MPELACFLCIFAAELDTSAYPVCRSILSKTLSHCALWTAASVLR